ncbi:hypothetical protein HDV00_002232 [Rhizophlyctis rosea]|nr:hypothetical protein HDV00_002232 [Rhizophlyctis rosea]
MCSAPGGKTLMMVEMIDGQGTVVANELDKDRMRTLIKAARAQIPHELAHTLELRLGDGRKLHIDSNSDTSPLLPWWTPEESHETTPPNTSRALSTPFTHILLDAPCSGEGTITLSSPKSYANWSPQYVSQHATLQKHLLRTALSLLAPNGTLVYSTCTLSPLENECIVDEVLKGTPYRVEIVPLPTVFWEMEIAGFEKGLREWDGRVFGEGMDRCLRVFPGAEYEGFFVCKMKKGS